MKPLFSILTGYLAGSILGLAHVGIAQAQATAVLPAVATQSDRGVVGAAPELIVVLQDGAVLRGRVTRDDDRIVLTRDGAEMRIQSANVLLIAATLEDAYRERRERMQSPTADTHLALGEWCLSQNMLASAEQELAAARSRDATAPKLELLERRLALAKERHTRPASTVLARTPKEPQPEELITVDTTNSVSDLPPGAVVLFTRRVQPVLVNNCTTAGCHQAGSNEKFQLDRAVLRGLSNRRTTTNNLAATLALIDYERPNESPLLTIPRLTHGGMEDPIFGPRHEAAFRHLAEWVALVTQKELQAGSQLAAQGQPGLTADANMSAGLQPVLDGGNAPVNASDQQNNTGASGARSTGSAEITPVTIGPNLRFGARIERWEPRDSFDPEIFNRQTAALRGDVAEDSVVSRNVRSGNVRQAGYDERLTPTSSEKRASSGPPESN